MDDAIPRSLLLIFLIIAGGFFSGAETAFSYTNTVRVRMLAENRDRRARRAVRILDNYDMSIVTLLVLINIIHIAASAVATAWFIDITGSAALGPVLATVIVTLAIFIFSETLPKNFAKTNCDSYVLMSSLAVGFFMTVLFPITFLLTKLGSGVKKVFHLEEKEPSLTEDEFAIMVEDAADEDVFEPAETEIIKSAIEFGDTRVEEIMTPKAKIVAIPLRADGDEIKEILVNEKYSRFPVYRGSVNNIVGVLRTANALWKMINSDDDFDLRDNMAKPMFCSPEDSISSVFERMCNRKNHFSVVRDDEMKTVGIITMEDILEELFGEIYDEDDAVSEQEGATDE